MGDFHIYAVFIVFGAVILAITFDVVDMVLAALLGLCGLTLIGAISQKDVINAVVASEGSLSLLFGGMIVARVLAPTGVFENMGTRFLLLTQGSGKRFLLLLTLLTAVVCAILPNATTVILLAPLVVATCRALDVDVAGPMIFTAIVSNSAGLLTLVGDPATFLVGQSIGLGFTAYLKNVSPGGVLCILGLIPLMPLLLPTIWKTRRELPEGLKPEPIKQPNFCIFSLLTLGFMVTMFLFGESMPHPVAPPAAAIIGASLALLVIYSARVERVDAVLRDVDWKTILFIFCMMIYVELVTKTGVIAGLSRSMFEFAGTNLLKVSVVLLSSVGLASGFLANIPVVAAAVLMTKGYLVLGQFVPETALGVGFDAWPQATLPVFIAMMFSGTLGGNATLIGASANLVAAGVCAKQGRQISFVAYMRYGAPAAVVQLILGGLYVWLKLKML